MFFLGRHSNDKEFVLTIAMCGKLEDFNLVGEDLKNDLGFLLELKEVNRNSRLLDSINAHIEARFKIEDPIQYLEQLAQCKAMERVLNLHKAAA